ncbi:MAG: bile acid:sodium symporter family protein [Pseudomonadales bacterium]|nr:bile acid:sodium symporter family protein [Pseudomonadales bacterium]
MDLVNLFYSKAIPLGLIAVMAGMGLSLTIDDIKRVLTFPKAAAIGLSGQLLFLPLLGFLIAWLFSPTPVVAVGLILLASCPGGATSNAYVFASRADVALSVTLTGICSFVTIFTIPLLVYLGMKIHFESGEIPDFPVIAMAWKLAKLTVIPIIAGMLVRKLWPDIANKLVEPMRTLAFWILIVLIIGGTISGWDTIKENYLAVGASAIALNFLSMSLAYCTARLFNLPLKQVITITYELGVQNIAVAMLVASTLLKRPDLSVIALVYALIMKTSAITFMIYAKKVINREAVIEGC